jgi:hypothetical protein
VAGAMLSRWTMSYFIVALASLMCAQALMALGYGFPAVSVSAPETLVVVHLVAVGWLSLMMCGALFQFVPVLVARPIHSNSLPLPALVLLLTGLAALLVGFLQLAGQVGSEPPLFPTAAALLSLGFTLVLWNLGRTLWAARPLPLSARFVTVGLFSVAATVIFGVIFALVLGSTATAPHLLDVTAFGLPIHIVAGLGGWLTFTAIGVSYRLLAMFMLAPELNGRSVRGVYYFGTAALAVVVVGGAAAICNGASLEVVLDLGAALGAGALALYGSDMAHLYRARKRRRIELNSRMAAIALMNLAAVALLTAIFFSAGELEQHAAALLFLASFGWLSAFGLSQLYKIVAFVTWLESYGPVLGKATTPRVQDLVVESRAIKWFFVYFAAVWTASACLFMGFPTVFRVAVAAMLTATAGIVVQLARTRLLVDVKPALRLHGQVPTPRLLRTSIQNA